MELRVLRYFLMVAREENITRAAQLLHVSQPTLSRQLINLEEELGVKLFHRGKYSVRLTEDGLLLKRRAQELLTLTDKTMMELSHKENRISGEISIGCGETRSMMLLGEWMASFQAQYPDVQFHIYSATADDIKERIEKGILDMGLLTEPVNIGKYEFIRAPMKERWGVLVRKDSSLAQKDCITPEDLIHVPLLMSRRELIRNELASWFKGRFEEVHVAATYNLIVNAATLVRCNVGVALCFDLNAVYKDLCFIPLYPVLETGSVLVWKRNETLSTAFAHFVHMIKNN